ncbi:gamma carbonic anhydrase family protein [Rhodomicrobium lacus]|uniref:gamma carbonic anhydrase family protein n=1 Tax=Rhodomicrobium lacus TaxID=2498452 RepID=UPI0026E3B76E|nr:hypothetical protein [Rhodomicrobium lacus]WKW51286.1 hypothetical protein QMO75_01975 [Rhodomicrobium lacus]
MTLPRRRPVDPAWRAIGFPNPLTPTSLRSLGPERHGRQARIRYRARYRALLTASMRRVAAEPDGVSTSNRDELLAGIRSFHIHHSRTETREALAGHPVSIGDEVSIGHGTILHGCTIANHCLIGRGARLLDGVRLAEETLVGAAALVLTGVEYPANVLLIGAPARIARPLTEGERQEIRLNAERYVSLSRVYEAA